MSKWQRTHDKLARSFSLGEYEEHAAVVRQALPVAQALGLVDRVEGQFDGQRAAI